MGAVALAALPRIRAAIIGTGHAHAAGKRKVLAESPDYELTGVYEPGAEAERMLADQSIRLVAVETAVPDLMPWGRKVIDAGKHLHLDKPPSDRMEPFRAAVEEARRRKLLFQTGYIWRFHEGFRAAFDLARSGKLGSVYMVRGTINTDLTPAQRESVALYRGGMMFELGCHMIDRIVDLLGRPRDVKSWLRHDIYINDRLNDNALAVLEYEGALAVVSSSARTPSASAHRSFEIIGSDGSVTLAPPEPGVKMLVDLRTGKQEVSFPPQIRYIGDFRDMARAIRTGTPLQYGYDFELLVQETLLRAC